MKKISVVFATVTFFLLSVLPAAFSAPNPERDVYYGETHLHTSWSFDAFIFGDTKSTPEDAYNYAKGKPLKHALGYEMKSSSRSTGWA